MRKALRIIREPRTRSPSHRECMAILLSERLRRESARRRQVPWIRPQEFVSANSTADPPYGDP
jgi:hypothetical protein